MDAAKRVLGVLALVLTFLLLGNNNINVVDAQLTMKFYSSSYPNLLPTVRSVMQSAIDREARMDASILRLFYHDCFVNGCDGSVLLDDESNFTRDKSVAANRKLAGGFEVIDDIKPAVERECNGVVSCADILTIAARDVVVTMEGPNFDAFRFPPNTTLLSSLGGHTIGQHDSPRTAGSGDDHLAPLDIRKATAFDDNYYRNLVGQTALLRSDQQLFNGGSTDSLVRTYSNDADTFYSHFAAAMIKMGGVEPLTATAARSAGIVGGYRYATCPISTVAPC